MELNHNIRLKHSLCLNTKEIRVLDTLFGQGVKSVYCNPLSNLLTKYKIAEVFPPLKWEGHGFWIDKKRTDSQVKETIALR